MSNCISLHFVFHLQPWRDSLNAHLLAISFSFFFFYLACLKTSLEIAIVVTLASASASEWMFWWKFCMWWARGCQESYPLHGQVLFKLPVSEFPKLYVRWLFHLEHVSICSWQSPHFWGKEDGSEVWDCSIRKTPLTTQNNLVFKPRSLSPLFMLQTLHQCTYSPKNWDT